MALTSWSIASFPYTNCRSTSDQWTASGSGTNEYYLVNTGPILSAKPEAVYIGGTVAAEGTLSSLAAGEWAWGDADTIGADTLYVRLSDGADPDTEDSGHVQAYTGEAVELLDSTTNTIILLSLILANNDAGAAAVTVQRLSSADAVKMQWSLSIPSGNSPVAIDSKMVFAGGDKLAVISDTELVSVDASGDES